MTEQVLVFDLTGENVLEKISIEKLILKEPRDEDLSFDSSFYAELQFVISEELASYEDKCYPDKPQEIRDIEKEVQFGAFGKYSLSEYKQKVFNDYNLERIEKDPVFRMRAYADEFADGISYLQKVLARQYDKLVSQQKGDELMEVIKNTDKKKRDEQELDPFLLLVSRTNSLKEFLEDYDSQIKKLSELYDEGGKYVKECLALNLDKNRGGTLIRLYVKQFEFSQLFYDRKNLRGSASSYGDIEEEIKENQLFIKDNQVTLNKLIKPQYVALEHSKLIAVTKMVMGSPNPYTNIQVDSKGTKVTATITTDAAHQGMRIDSFDTLVEEAVGCILDINSKNFDEGGFLDITLSTIAQQALVLNVGAHISKEQRRAVTESMNKLRHIFVKVDFKAQAEAHKKLNIDVQQAVVEDNALNYTKTTVLYRGNPIEVYRLHAYPPRYKYSKAVRQISGISRELIYLPNMNITKGVAILRRYLIEYIESIKASNLSKTVFFDTINDACEGHFAYESKEAKRDFRKKVAAVLEGFTNNGYIKGFEFVKEGRILKGVKIEP